MFPDPVHRGRLAEEPRGGGLVGLHGRGGGPSVVLTADHKPRLRWTADLHDRFVDAVAQLGGPDSEHHLPLSQEVKEALRTQMEFQRRLHEQVEVQKHMQLRMEANKKYMDTILNQALKLVYQQLSGFNISDHDLPGLSSAGILSCPEDLLVPSVFQSLSVSFTSLHRYKE